MEGRPWDNREAPKTMRTCSFLSHHSVTPINQDYFGALLIYLVDYLGRLSEAFHRSEGRTQSQWQTRR
jgi:hypothetical protein